MPDDWNPSKPLPDPDTEKEANDRAQAAARVKYLTDQYSAAVTPTPKKKKGPFGD